MSNYKTLADLLIGRKFEEQKGITFILGDDEEKFVSYKELFYTASRLLYELQQAGFKTGDEVIFQIDDNQRFVYSFWACILGGMIPVPVTTGTNDEHKLKLFKIWSILNNPRIIATSDFLEKLDAFAGKTDLTNQMDIIRGRALFVDSSIQTVRHGEIHQSEPEDIAFIQFSSGSTGDPKGVIITHSNVFTNLNAVIRWAHIDSNDAGLNWMPLTHDMGLIGTHIKDVIACINQYNIQTTLFIRHPSLWIKKASEHRVTLLYSPNFGYKHFLKFYNPDQSREWDLSSIRLIYNGAEPISIELCNEFLDKMSEHGLKRTAMLPVYGLAEGTIAMTFPYLGEEFRYHILNRNHLGIGEEIQYGEKEDKNSVAFMDVGYPIYDSKVRICNEDNIDIGECKIGYIHISGGNVTSGYYNNLEATQNTISDGWLNTGDLGFVKDGRLVITGRAKDVIFIAGQNYYSHDIERVCEGVEGIELGKIAAVGVFNEKLKCDELLLFVMSKQKLENFMPSVYGLKKIISKNFGIEVSEVIPVKNIPKTTSGKVQRYKLRESYINDEFDLIKQSMHNLMDEEFNNRIVELPESETEKKLAAIWSEILQIDRIGNRDNFFELGGDSLKITQLISRVRDEFTVELDQAAIFDNPEIKSLARFMESLTSREQREECIKAFALESGRQTLSFSQKRLWFLDKLNGSSAQYNLSTALLIVGALNVEVLNKSLNCIIRRHKVLQMSFAEENGVPVQILNSEAGINIDSEAVESLDENDEEISGTILKEANLPFDLEKAPLMRCKLLCTGENRHILVLVVHHIVFDGWSFGILLKELNIIYEAYINKREHCLAQMDIQYTDYACWQNDSIQKGRIDFQLEYWKKNLSGRLPILDMPLDKQRPAVQTYNGSKFTSLIPSEIVGRLKTYARKENATLFMVLLAAFKVLLYRYSGQSDIIVGSPVANRNRREIEGLIGFFTNNLVLRTSFRTEIRFSELLKHVKKVTLDAFSYQDVPFEKLVEELHIERDLSRNPLFQAFFSLQNTPLPILEFSELNVSSLDIGGSYSRFDISIDMRESGGGLAADFEYNTDLFSKDSIVRMAGHFKQLLLGIAKDPDCMLDSLEMLTREERKTLIYEWNDTAKELGSYSNWVEAFERQAASTPENIAVVCAGESLTYRQLDEHSNQLANYLISQQIGPENIIGVYIDRSVNMLVGLLGIHKAGAAYLPMDPIFPKDRILYMLEDAKAVIILSEEKFASTLPINTARVLCLDKDIDVISSCSELKPEKSGGENSLAYVIYTSGSTGKPKGVQIEQHALVNFLLSMGEKTAIQESDSLLVVTTLSFDIAGLELYMPLICGAKVVIAQREDVVDGSRLIELLDMHGITIMQATPATWRLLIESGWKGGVQKLLCGGEALPADLAGQLLQRSDELYNVYGPTETTIWSTLARLEAPIGSVHIGRPIGNTQIYILDKSMNPVPAGIPGELYIGGDGVARGYLNLPELTSEKFISDPFSLKKGARMYRTGDMVKIRPDGNIDFIGRIDNQVKIRGFRIELGEIETLLNQNKGIQECVVVAKEIISGEKSLVAYIIPTEGSRDSLNTEDLRRVLKDELPDYMVPSAFVYLEAYPMTPNGKIDKKALPMPKVFSQGPENQYAPASNEGEKVLSEIWQEVLKVKKVGVDENFFDLGGHSLLLAQVKSRIAKLLNREISIMDLFKYPTIRTLSRFLDGESEPKPSVSMDKKSRETEKNRDIAIIGLSGRFPGAKNTDEFWENLCKGIEAISNFTDEEIMEEGIDYETLKKPGYVKAWGVLEDIERFDARFFGYNPREAEVLDPQQRIFLEESWKALENAGYDPEKFHGAIGVYASVGMNTYAQNLKENYGDKGLASDYQIMISNDKDFLATRVAYKLNLEGPCITVQTACSSSLVAVHLACQSLINGECDMALAGGVSIRLPQKSGYIYQEGMILSPDGHCRAFDEEARGTVGGNGAGIVVLKPLENALLDRDDIFAVIKGSAINNDGSMKIGYTAPRIDGQANVIEEAQRKAGVRAESFSYIETHGTGTLLGDPIEIEALTKAFRKSTDKKVFCAIGSAKTNVGHLDSAAGVTGLIKTVLSLRNKKLPPSLNFKKPNPKIDFANSPFYVNSELSVWSGENLPLRAGVSSFGIGGTNAHVVLEEAPVLVSDQNQDLPVILTFSAKSRNSLEKITFEFKEFLKRNAHLNIADAAYTLQVGRREHEYRRFLVCSSAQEAIKTIENFNKGDGKVLSSSDGQNMPNSQNYVDNPEEYTLEQIGMLWLEDAKINWSKLYANGNRKRIALPAYPFEGEKYWVKRSTSAETPKSDYKTKKRKDISEWFYTPVWKQSFDNINIKNCKNLDGTEKPDSSEGMLIIGDEAGFAQRFANKLKQLNKNTIAAYTGDSFKSLEDGGFIFDAGSQKDYQSLIRAILNKGNATVRIVNLLGITETDSILDGEDSLKSGMRLFYSMIYVAQALGEQSLNFPIQLKVITNNAQKIFGEKHIYPEKNLHLGACRVIPNEYPNIRCSSIDILLPEYESQEESDLLSLLANEVYGASDIGKSDRGVSAYRGLERWMQNYEGIKLDDSCNSAIKLKDRGVYIITGGLGGLGMETAEYLAREVKAKLVLLGHSEFPDMSGWDNWIETRGIKDAVSVKILKLRKLQSIGADVLVCRADLSNKIHIADVKRKAETKFGAVNGIFHAAGKPGGGLMQLRKKESVEQVLLPKVKGTAALYEIFKDSGLDFFIFYSSLNAITGGFGQIDYSAANAYLDAFAHKYDSKNGTRFVSIDWDRWPGVGMAAGTMNSAAIADNKRHPLLGGIVSESLNKVIFRGELSPGKDWVLSEHLVMGIPTIAGTTYLEMARAAFEELTCTDKAEISNVIFLTPMSVEHNESREVFTIMEGSGSNFYFRIVSISSGEESDNGKWFEHVRGRISSPGENPGTIFDLQELKQKAGLELIFEAGGKQKLSEEFISFGTRWRSLKKFSTGKNTGLVEVELTKSYSGDLEDYKLHPALLDVATGAVRLAAKGNYLPFSYEKLNVWGQMPERFYAYISFKNGLGITQEVITCDIDIINESGVRIIEIRNFSMRLIDDTAAAGMKTRSAVGMARSDYSFLEKLQKVEDRNDKSGVFNEGINPKEGQYALGQILSGCRRPQIIVSTKDINTAIEQAGYINQPNIKEALVSTDADREFHPRPELENEFVQAKTEDERKLAEIWQNILSIDRVGINDEFFALGGDSLLLIQLHSKIKENFETELAVVDLYKYNTVALLSKYISVVEKSEEQPAFEEVNNRVSKQMELMKKRRQQMQNRKEVLKVE